MTKKIILLLAFLLTGLFGVKAQDLIVKRNSVQIKAKVEEVASDAIRYKRFSNLTGPTYVIPTKEILYIQYENGEKDVFHMEPLPQEKSNEVTPLHTQMQPQQNEARWQTKPQMVARTYEIGEFYSQDGLKGVVCALNEERTHGLIISLEEIYLHWSEFRKPNLRLIGANDLRDGEVNMKIVEEYILKNQLTWDDFPAFKWCRDKGEGWYLPSVDELLTISNNYNGGNRTTNNRKAKQKFNDALKDNGGDRMDRLVYYFSSTERDAKDANTVHMDIEPPYVVPIAKYTKFLVRAVHRF